MAAPGTLELVEKTFMNSPEVGIVHGDIHYVIQEGNRRGDQILVLQYAQLLAKRIQTGSWAHFLNLLRSLNQVFREYYLNKD